MITFGKRRRRNQCSENIFYLMNFPSLNRCSFFRILFAVNFSLSIFQLEILLIFFAALHFCRGRWKKEMIRKGDEDFTTRNNFECFTFLIKLKGKERAEKKTSDMTVEVLLRSSLLILTSKTGYFP